MIPFSPEEANERLVALLEFLVTDEGDLDEFVVRELSTFFSELSLETLEKLDFNREMPRGNSQGYTALKLILAAAKRGQPWAINLAHSLQSPRLLASLNFNALVKDGKSFGTTPLHNLTGSARDRVFWAQNMIQALIDQNLLASLNFNAEISGGQYEGLTPLSAVFAAGFTEQPWAINLVEALIKNRLLASLNFNAKARAGRALGFTPLIAITDAALANKCWAINLFQALLEPTLLARLDFNAKIETEHCNYSTQTQGVIKAALKGQPWAQSLFMGLLLLSISPEVEFSIDPAQCLQDLLACQHFHDLLAYQYAQSPLGRQLAALLCLAHPNMDRAKLPENEKRFLDDVLTHFEAMKTFFQLNYTHNQAFFHGKLPIELSNEITRYHLMSMLRKEYGIAGVFQIDENICLKIAEHALFQVAKPQQNATIAAPEALEPPAPPALLLSARDKRDAETYDDMEVESIDNADQNRHRANI